jgi:hypothetical protein
MKWVSFRLDEALARDKVEELRADRAAVQSPAPRKLCRVEPAQSRRRLAGKLF